MIAGVTRQMLPHLSGVPHLHVNRPYLRPMPAQYPIAFRPDMKKSQNYPVYSMISNDDTELEQVVHAHLPEEVSTLNLNPHL